MSTKTTFKRIALVAVATLGLGVLSVAPSQAVLIGETLTIDAATDTATTGDTATAVLTHSFSGTINFDSSTITSACSAPAGYSCPTLAYYQSKAQAQDTSTATAHAGAAAGAILETGSWTDSSTTAAGSITRTIGIKNNSAFLVAGTYKWTLYTNYHNTGTGLGQTTPATGNVITWTVTVSDDNKTGTQLSASYIAADVFTASSARNQLRASSDSAVVVDKGSAATPAPVAYAFFTVANSAGETKTVSGNVVNDSLTVTITSGPGLLSSADATPSSGSTQVTLNIRNAAAVATTETLTILSNGIAGATTISVRSVGSGSVIKTFTVTFSGTPASAAIALSDTIVSLTAGSTIVGTVKDSGGNVMKSGTVYVYSSDTKVAGTNLSTNAYPTTATGYTIPSTGVLAYTLTTTDTGVATITLRDSWTVAASTWTSNEVVVDVRGSTIVSLTVAFDKATYSPGERAVITYTATGSNGKGMATAAITGLTAISNATMTDVIAASITGTNSGTGNFTVLGTSFQGFMDTGVETRVVTMPTFAGAVNLTNTFATFGSTTGAKTTVTSTATVVDANAVAAAAATAAAKDASDAATDAALEATDAAYAATDAANIAAEAADAATAAAEAATEAANAAKESADAATAAVEELATSVAKLMAALQAQITTLAKVVAKIAVKVKA